jgi:hypothetical protein
MFVKLTEKKQDPKRLAPTWVALTGIVSMDREESEGEEQTVIQQTNDLFTIVIETPEEIMALIRQATLDWAREMYELSTKILGGAILAPGFSATTQKESGERH